MINLPAMQQALKDLNVDAWLLYDFRGINNLARRVLGFPDNAHLTRRWFYLIPQKGEPQKLVHKIEPTALDAHPGTATKYTRWQELEAGVGNLLKGFKRVAMEYVPRNANPYISRVDAGTIELVKSFGVEIIPSGDLIQLFEATWDEEQWKMHLEAAVHTRSAYDVAFAFIREQVNKNGSTTEVDVQNRIMAHFAEHGMTTDHGPIVGVGPHSGDPHYAPSLEHNFPIKEGDFVLIDLWAKLDKPRAVYSDLTRTCYVGTNPPEKYQKIFKIVADARDAGINCVKKAYADKRPLQGWEVDTATRKVIDDAGYGDYFTHRTGHNIGQETHGNGAHMDGFETREERLVMPRTCFSIEPGIYLPEFGVRSEVNVYIDANGGVHVTGGDVQTEIHCI